MARSRHFPAGLKLPSLKSGPMGRSIRVTAAPSVVALALDQGNGSPARPVVAVGDRVRVGTLVGRGDGDFAVDVHSTVAGVVRSLEVRPVAGAASTCPCLLVENDATLEREETPTPIDWQAASPAELLSRIRSAGIAGLGGAAFATHAKLAAARAAGVSHLVLNGAECEPWICCDDALMRERAADVVLGARVMQRVVDAARVTITIEDDKPEAIAAIEAALAAAGSAGLGVEVLPATYPAGAERQLLASVTGVEVPGGAWPPAAGLLCQNVGTAAAVARLVTAGEPPTHRIVTVTGSGVAEPANVEARLGTPIADLIEACGGYRGEPLRLIAGGNMTGRALPSDDAPVTQALNCVVVATATDLVPHGSEMPCIRCGDCASVCPAGLLPQSLLRAVLADDLPGLERHGLADCIECGCCDYVCPSRIPLTARFADARRERRLRLDDQRRAARARERYAGHERRLAAAAEAERREFEDARRRARGEGPP
jgi:electron transport complex protein RnfC